MIRIFTVFTMLLLFSCSSQPAPAWQQDSFVNMNNFISTFMEGNDKFAQNYHNRLIESLKMTTDPDELVKAHLIKCSLDFSLMNYIPCTEAEPFVNILKKEENIIYYNFISGKDSIPAKYNKISESIKPCDTSKLNKEIKKLEEPLSKLIASSFAINKGCYDEKTLMNAVETASGEGWKKASLRYLEFSVKYYEKKGDINTAENLKKRISFLND
jgi:hypothetical protein